MKQYQSIDAFGRMRVSDPVTLFNSKQTVDNQPLFWDDAQVSGSGTSSAYLTNKSATRISVGATTAGKRVRQSKRRLNYQPGKSQLVMITAVFGDIVAGVTKRVGYFDEKNGLFFQLDSGGIKIGKRSYATGEAVDTIVASSAFNITGDFNGFSDVYDFTKATIFWINFEWLGVGSCQFGIVEDGEFQPLHQFDHAGVTDVVYMTMPNLPIRYEIDNDGTGAAASMDCICSTVISEGGDEFPGLQLSYSNDVATPSNATTFSGGTEIMGNIGTSTTTVAGTDLIDFGNAIALGSTIAGVSDVLVVCASRITGTTETFYGSINWLEIY
jgi:hypothetical protein